MLAQGQNDGQAESINESEDFEDLDELFPIKNEPEVEELEWNVQRELTFKRRMVCTCSYKFGVQLIPFFTNFFFAFQETSSGSTRWKR